MTKKSFLGKDLPLSPPLPGTNEQFGVFSEGIFRVRSFKGDPLRITYMLFQVLGLPSLLLAKDAVYDKEHGQYAVVKLATEATVLKMRAYSLALEVNHTLKYMSKDVLAAVAAISVSTARINIV